MTYLRIFRGRIVLTHILRSTAHTVRSPQLSAAFSKLTYFERSISRPRPLGHVSYSFKTRREYR